MLNLHAENTTHIKTGTHFCVGFKEVNEGEPVYCQSLHSVPTPTLHKWDATLEIINK